MNTPNDFARKCAGWTDAHLLIEYESGPAAYADPELREVMRAELVRRGLRKHAATPAPEAPSIDTPEALTPKTSTWRWKVLAYAIWLFVSAFVLAVLRNIVRGEHLNSAPIIMGAAYAVVIYAFFEIRRHFSGSQSSSSE